MDGAGRFDVAAARAIVRDNAPFRHAAAAAARPAAENDGRRGGRRTGARSLIRYLGSVAAGDRDLDGRKSRTGSALARCSGWADESRKAGAKYPAAVARYGAG